MTEQELRDASRSPSHMDGCCLGVAGLASDVALTPQWSENLSVEPAGWGDVLRSGAVDNIFAVPDICYPMDCHCAPDGTQLCEKFRHQASGDNAFGWEPDLEIFV